MSDPVIRLARPGEYAAIGQLTLEAYTVDGFHAPEADYGKELLDAEGRAGKAELYVATDADGTLLGTATYCPPGSDYAEIAGAEEADLRMVAVARSARGRGIGEALVRHILARAREQELAALVLSSSEAMHAAHRLYERLGFVRTPERDWRPVPEILLRTYRKPL